MVVSGISEGLSLASLIPVLNSISDPQSVLRFKIIGNFLRIFNFTNDSQIIISVVSIFSISFFIAALLRTLNIWLNTRYSALAGHDIGIKVFKSIIFIPYEKQILINSSEEINALITHVNNCVILFENFLQLFTSLVISSLLLTILILINWKVAFFTIFLFSLAYFYISMNVRNKLVKNSGKIANFEESILQDIQESLGSIRDIILRSNYSLLIKKFSDIDYKLRLTRAENNFIGSYPRYILESMGLLLMVFCIIFFTLNNIAITSIIPILGSFALGSQKLLPTLQQTYYGWVALKAYSTSSFVIIKKLRSINQSDQFLNPTNKIHKLKNQIELKNVFFRYNDTSPYVFKDINLIIKKGDKIGLVGKSGSGKSTLVDIFMGLLPPVSGEVLVDGINIYAPQNIKKLKAWRNSIAHVPQSIFLLNTTIEKNIAFSFSTKDIDKELIIKSSQKAQLHDYVDSLSSKYQSLIGERGIRISGGQKQRIAIARAFYKKANVFVFDEATSSLDNSTEDKIVNKLKTFSDDITSLTIAHRLNTLTNCDRKIEVKNGKINEIN